MIAHSLKAPLFTLIAAALLSPLHAGPPEVKLGTDGIVISAGAGGSYTLDFPSLRKGSADYKGESPVVSMSGANSAVAKYPSGAELRVTLHAAERKADYTYSNIPKGATSFTSNLQIPINFTNGGSFIIGKKPEQPFPLEKGKQIIGDGWTESVTLRSPSGAAFRLDLPGDYVQIQDNRVFGWQIFMLIYNYNFASRAGAKSYTIRFGEAPSTAPAAPPAPVKVLVDRFGQSTRVEFANKVKSEEELKKDAAQEESRLTPPAGPALDSYGGLAGSGEKLGLKKTGYFHIGQAEGRQVLVTPEGNAFFQLAVCGINLTDDYTLVAGREKIYEWLPPKDETYGSAWRKEQAGVVSFYAANWIRKFGKPFTMEEWSGQVVKRLRAWGFNSGGAFSAQTSTMRGLNFPYVKSLPVGEYTGAPVLPDKLGATQIIDPFADGAEAALDKAYAKNITPVSSDPLLIGWFDGNETHLELLPKKLPAYKASTCAAKRKLVETLQTKYGTIEAFNKAWTPAKPFASFDELKEEPLFVRSEAAAADMQTFYREFLETYYSMVERVFRKYDPNHLLIGNRLTPGTANNKDAVEISGRHVDVISVNYYTYPIEKEFLSQIHTWSGGRPIILSEWYYSAIDQGLGGGKEVADQKERAMAYRNYVEQAAALPYVVGSQWFIYNDQSITGRFFEGFNGEGNNTGLVNVTDRPYEELVAATRETGGRIYDVMFGKSDPYVFNDARFHSSGQGGSKVVSIPKALPGFKFDGTTTNWPGRPAEPIESSRLVIGPANPNLRGDFRLCWDATNLYFLIQVKDSTPAQNTQNAKAFWSGDCIELFVGAKDLKQKGSLIYSDRQILLKAGKTPAVAIADHEADATECNILVVPDVSGDGYVLEAAFPWKTLGITPSAGQEFLFDVALDNSDDGLVRKQQLVWNGTAKNSSDRGAWGKARLVEN